MITIKKWDQSWRMTDIVEGMLIIREVISTQRMNFGSEQSERHTSVWDQVG